MIGETNGRAALCARRSSGGTIWWERYESYLRLRDEAEEVFYRC